MTDKIASGHITYWEGGSLWVFDVPAPGPTPRRNDQHAHHAFQLTFAFGGEFSLHFEDRIVSGPVALVAPDAPHAFEAAGRVGMIFVEPESPAGRTLTKLTGGEPGLSVSADMIGGTPTLICQALADPPRRQAALREIGIGLYRSLSGPDRVVDLDRRVRQMIQWAGEHLDSATGINEAADLVGLSSSRASHLFVDQTGLPFRTYLLWLRLGRAMEAYTGGQSLTDAAQEAGFADSAHLSRTFRRMFGIAPTSLAIS